MTTDRAPAESGERIGVTPEGMKRKHGVTIGCGDPSCSMCYEITERARTERTET